MLAASTLAKHYRRVSIVDSAHVSKRIPQGIHLHVLLKRGQDVFEKIMPSVVLHMKERCPQIDWAYDSEWVGPFGTNRPFRSGIITSLASRAYLDSLMQNHIATITNIFPINGTGSIVLNEKRAIGANINRENRSDFLKGDVIVDARGRQSDLGQTLAAIGITLPRDFLDSSLSYSTRIFRAAKNAEAKRQYYVQVRAGFRDHGVVISPIEDERFVVTLIQNGGNPPKTEREFMKALERFSDKTKGLLVDEPLSSVHVFRNFSSRRYSFTGIPWPSNLVAIGDAACVLNPVYGQGMTLAAIQAAMLDSFVGKPSWESKFQRAVDDTTYFPWLAAQAESGVDNQSFTQRALAAYLEHIMRAATSDAVVNYAFIRTMHMLDQPISLMKPNLALRALLRRRS